MAVSRSFKQLVRQTCWKIVRQFVFCLVVLYIIPLLSISVRSIYAGSELSKTSVLAIFFNVTSWLYISIILLVIILINISQLLLLIRKELDVIYKKSMWGKSETTEELTLSEFVETQKRLDNMQSKIRLMLEEEKEQKEDLMFQVSAVSHDIKTPLTVIQGNSELLKHKLSDENVPYLTDLISASQQLDNYINQLINYSRTLYKDDSEWSVYSAKELVELIQQESLYIVDKGIKLKFKVDIHQSIRFKANFYLLVRAILNILSNAASYANKERPVILFSVKVESNQMIFSIWNNGAEFSSEVMENFGKLFYKEDRSRNVQGSHYGIGLAFVKKVAELHNGYVQLSNKENGALVELYIKTSIPNLT